MTDSPLYDATLSDLLLQARRRVERARTSAEQARRQAAEQVAEVQREAERRVREERVRRALIAEEVEEQVRASLVAAPPLPPLQGRVQAVDGPVEEVEPEAPPVPSMAELLRPSPGVTRFLDTLLGPSTP